MSNATFPVLPGLSWDRKRTPEWKTIVQESASGLESRTALWSYPRWNWELAYDLLRSAAALHELQDIVGFFNARRGAFDSFLFDDPDDNAALAQAIGTGNGSTVAFQAVRMFGGFVEPVYNLKATPVVYVNGTAQAGVTYSSAGIITLASAPSLGAVVTADLSYYWRVRFAEDMTEFNQFMSQLYECQKLLLKGVKGS